MNLSIWLEWSKCRTCLAGGLPVLALSSRTRPSAIRPQNWTQGSRLSVLGGPAQSRAINRSRVRAAPLRRLFLRNSPPKHPQTIEDSLDLTDAGESAPRIVPARHAHGSLEKPSQSRLAVRQLQSQQELMDLVGADDGANVEDHLEFFRDPYRRGYAQPEGPQLGVSDSPVEWHYPGPAEVASANDYEERVLLHLRTLLSNRRMRRDAGTLEEIYKTYRRLPEPRMQYLTGSLRHSLLYALGFPDERSVQSMLRHFAVLADVKAFALNLTRGEWNAAIAHASRYVARSTHGEAEEALVLWKEMEQVAGIVGNDVTFNILFDVASKAGNFTLAEMLYQEMESRGHLFNRYHHVSLIHFFGLKQDTIAVRAAYREMVRHGEIIDSVVLNCVLSGFLKSAEEQEAEQLYEKMKSHRGVALALPNPNGSTLKAINQAFALFARVSNRYPSMRSIFQDLASIEPTLQTYRLLLNYYGVRAGNIVKVAQFLDDMKAFNIPLHGAIFLALFKSFATHGGHSNTSWTMERLGGVWSALLEALDAGHEGLVVTTWLALWALRAFKKCGSTAQVVHAYEQLSTRWNLDADDTHFMAQSLQRLLSPTGRSTAKRHTRSRKSWESNAWQD